jgi:quercetin dioxygenase-like cupin family protein
MDVLKIDELKDNKIESFPYKGRPLEVKGVSVRWLSREGEDESGQPEYGLRLFTVEPGGEIPIHKHLYMQTMYFLSGRFECFEYDSETDEVVSGVVCGPGEVVFVPGMEPHGMRNVSDTETGQFLCCICTLYD